MGGRKDQGPRDPDDAGRRPRPSRPPRPRPEQPHGSLEGPPPDRADADRGPAKRPAPQRPVKRPQAKRRGAPRQPAKREGAKRQPTKRQSAKGSAAPPADETTSVDASVTESEARSARTDRRQLARRRRRRFVAAAAVVAMVAAGFGAWAVFGGDDTKVKAAAPTTTTTTTTPPTTVAAPASATTATTKVPELQVFDAPADTAAVVSKFSDTTEYGLPRTLLVTERQPGWLHALLPQRPNGSAGWVRESDVTLGSSPYKIKIELAAHKVTLTKDGQPVLESPAVIGKKETPTPLGTFYITDPVDLRSRPNGAYGAFALGLSGYSEVLMEFNGGPGQIALHGTPNPDQVGQDISNGCIRVPNDIILKIVEQNVPLGTPVEIVA